MSSSTAAVSRSDGSPGPLRAVVIGCGIIGRHHAKVLTQHPGFEVVGLIDPLAEKVAEVTEIVTGLGAQAPISYASISEAGASGAVDLAAICTPSGFHIALAEESVGAGLHTVIEKPLDVSVPLGTRFATLAKDAADRGQLVSVISQHRFDPANAAIRQGIAGGSFGTVTSAMASMAWYRSQQYYDQGDWRGTWALDGGGAVMNQGVHTVDLLRWFLGRPVEIFAQTAQLAHERIEIEDTAVATISFESGALATLHATTAAFPGLQTRIQVHGTKGSAIVSDDQLEYYFSTVEAEGFGTHGFSPPHGAAVRNQADQIVSPEHRHGADTPREDFINGHSRQYDDIAAAIAENRAPGVTVEEALLSLTLVRSFYVSATLDQPILFEDMLAGKYDDVVAVVGSQR